MSVFGKIPFKKVVTVMIGGAAVISMSACSTTKTIKHTKAAPIKYKVGQGAAKYASLNMPSRPNTAAPYISNQPTAPRMAMPTPSPRGMSPVFDQSRIDRDLYKHQKVGKKYSIMGKSYKPKHQPGYNEVGIASWYGDKFHGKPTATGEIYNKNDITAAHKTLPLNSMLYVTNLENGRTLMVRLNDRGPFIGDRIIDLSEAAANALGTKGQGLGKVRVQYAGPADPMAAKGGRPAPQPQYVPQEQDRVAEAPRSITPSVPEYRPLRQQPLPRSPMAQAPTPYTAPQIAERPVYETPRVAAPIAPQTPQPVAPAPQDEDGGQVTLTIKGPIHVAGYDDNSAQPRLIREVLKTK